MPVDLKRVVLAEGGAAARQSGNLTAIRLNDHGRTVYLLTTIHDDTMQPTRKRNQDGEPITKPAAILDYNKHKVGVDLADQLSSYYSWEKRSLKWYKKLFFHLFTVTVVNAFLLYNKRQAQLDQEDRQKLTHADFRLELAKELLAQANEDEPDARRATGRPPSQVLERIIPAQARHFQGPVPAAPSGSVRAKRCQVCQVAGIRKETRLECQKCRIPLCPYPCMEIYHTAADIRAARQLHQV